MQLVLSTTDDLLQSVSIGSILSLPEDSRNTVKRRRLYTGVDIIKFHTLSINIPDFSVLNGSVGIALTKKEFDLLLFCLTNGKRLMTKEALIIHLWNEQVDEDKHYSRLYVHIRNLRTKLIAKGCPNYFTSVYGIGYSFKLPR